MSTPIQLKINLTEELRELLQLKASKFGVPLTHYVKHVLMKDVEDEEYPVFRASAKTEEAAKQAMDVFLLVHAILKQHLRHFSL